MDDARPMRAIVPFAVVSLVGVFALFVPPYSSAARPWVALISVLALALTGWLATRTPATSPWFWLPPLLFLLFLLFLVAARLASGGTTSGISPLVIVPVLWVVLYGTRRQLLMCAVATALVYLLPVLALGSPDYDRGDLRRGVIWLVAIALAAPPVQAAIQNLRRTTRALRESERRWATLMEHLPETQVWVVGPDLTFRAAAETTPLDDTTPPSRAGRQNNATPQDGARASVGQPIGEVVPAAGVPALRAACLAALQGRPSDLDLDWFDGLHMQVSVVPLPDSPEGPEIMVVARDVTIARQREARLLVLNDRFERIFNDAPHGELLIDQSGLVTRVNPAMAAILGAPRASLERRPATELALTPAGRSALLRELLAGDTDRATFERSFAVDGSTRDVTVTAVAMQDQEGARNVLVSVVDLSELKAYERRLAHLADSDPLTGLANRRKFDAELAAHLERCRRYGPTGAVIMLDLDNFKQVNDYLGHGAGDQLIVRVAAALRRRLRNIDIVARLGGDEFAVLLPQADRASAALVASDITRLIARQSASTGGAGSSTVTASLGVVLIDDTAGTASDLMSTADMIMYDAKDAGRNRYLMHDPGRLAVPQTRARHAWARRISEALDGGSLVAYAQPILDLATDRITGAELLCRMIDEHGGVIPPARFLHIAERTGLIGRIDEFMLRRAIEVCESLTASHPDFQVHVNVSGKSLGDPDISARLTRLLGAGPSSRRNVVVELTETVSVANLGVAQHFASQVSALGCKFALDDFGAGFGSFYYLKNLTFDLVKIDGEFVSRATDNATDRLILSSIVSIAKGMGKKTVAEFVTASKVLELVREFGVDYAQGYAVGRPKPLEELFELIDSVPGESPDRPVPTDHA